VAGLVEVAAGAKGARARAAVDLVRIENGHAASFASERGRTLQRADLVQNRLSPSGLFRFCKPATCGIDATRVAFFLARNLVACTRR